MEDEVIKATVFDIHNGECLAIVADGSVIHIDPFVTAAFDFDHANKLIGTWLFKGFWNKETDSFLANEIMHPLEADISALQQQNKQLVEGMETIAETKIRTGFEHRDIAQGIINSIQGGVSSDN